MAGTKKPLSSSDIQKLKKDTIRMNINIPRTFYKAIQHKAIDEDLSVTDFVVKAIKKYINE